MDSGRDTGNSNIDQDGQERCEQRSKCVVHTTVLVDFDDLVNNPSHQIHPGKGGGKGKTGNNSVERLTFEFTGDEDSSFLSRHFLYIKLRFYSGRKSSSNKIFLYFFILSRPIEYVITQLQKSEFKFKAGESKKSGMLNFKHPVKEMFFLAVSDDVHKYETIKQVTMKFNNNTIIDADTLMLCYEQPLKYYTGITKGNFGVYSFSMNPETYYPTGQVNMSRIAHNLIEIELDTPDANFGHKVYVYAVNYNVLRIESGLGGLKF